MARRIHAPLACGWSDLDYLRANMGRYIMIRSRASEIARGRVRPRDAADALIRDVNHWARIGLKQVKTSPDDCSDKRIIVYPAYGGICAGWGRGSLTEPLNHGERIQWLDGFLTAVKLVRDGQIGAG